MKHLSFITAAIALVILTGCKGEGEKVEIVGNVDPAFEVVKLFEVDNVTVYRFVDGGRTVYFTNRTGTVQHQTQHTRVQGKLIITDKQQQITLCNNE